MEINENKRKFDRAGPCGFKGVRGVESLSPMTANRFAGACIHRFLRHERLGNLYKKETLCKGQLTIALVTPSVTLSFMWSLYLFACPPIIAARLKVRWMREKMIRENFKTKYFENRSSKLRTVFTFELLVSRSSKLDTILIGFEKVYFL